MRLYADWGGNMKNGNNLAGDETLYHQYLCGDDTGLDALMKRCV